jgi:hypothetical protein
MALLCSTLLMWLVARRMLRRRSTAAQPRPPEHLDELDRRLDDEITRLAELS